MLTLHYNGSNSFLLVNAAKHVNLKQKKQKEDHIYYVYIMFQKILQSIN